MPTRPQSRCPISSAISPPCGECGGSQVHPDCFPNVRHGGPVCQAGRIASSTPICRRAEGDSRGIQVSGNPGERRERQGNGGRSRPRRIRRAGPSRRPRPVERRANGAIRGIAELARSRRPPEEATNEESAAKAWTSEFAAPSRSAARRGCRMSQSASGGPARSAAAGLRRSRWRAESCGPRHGQPEAARRVAGIGPAAHAGPRPGRTGQHAANPDRPSPAASNTRRHRPTRPATTGPAPQSCPHPCPCRGSRDRLGCRGHVMGPEMGAGIILPTRPPSTRDKGIGD